MNCRTIVFVIAIILGIPVFAAANPIKNPKILILHSYNPEYKWTETEHLGIMDTLETLDREYFVYTEYLDWKRSPDQIHLKQMHDIWKEKYPDKGIDLVITTDDQALKFALDNRQELFSGAPVIFSGVTRHAAAEIIGDSPLVTGVYEDLPIEETITDALKIHPKYESAYIINEKTESGLETERLMKETLARLLPGKPVHSLGENSLEEIMSLVINLNPDTLLLIGTYSIEKKGRMFTTDILANRIGTVAKVPLFAIYAHAFGNGPIGGTMLNGAEQGNSAGRLAIRYLNGENFSALKPLAQTGFVTEFDWRVMRRFGIAASALPKGSIIVNREPPFFVRYRTESMIIGILFAALVSCISALLAFNRRIRSLAFTDQLTKLPNRTDIYLRADKLLAETDRGKQSGIMYIDIDNFKNINDSFGHETGDKVLSFAADILRKNAADATKIARFGGDEFLIFLTNVTSEQIEAFAKKIHESLKKKSFIDGREIFLTVSSGISLYPDHGSQFAELFKNADTAMYHAKDQGKIQYKFYDNAMSEELKRRVLLENGLRSAIDNDEIYVVYQPQIRLGTGRLEGLEILVRWKHPVEGIISPAEFIPIAEESGQISKIGSFVLRSAAKFIKRTQSAGIAGFSVSVNVSVRQLNSEGFYDELLAIVAEEGIASSRLAIEITESILMESFDRTTKLLDRIRKAGFKISLDDFGKGYSSLAYLRKLPITSVKMDKDFIDDMFTNDRSRHLACAIISLCHTLSLTVIAEGVETGEQMQFLKDNRCDYIQGYYFSRPETAEKVLPMLDKVFCEPHCPKEFDRA